MCDQVPESFKFAFKVTDEITIKSFPGLPRFGARKGMANANFLNPEMFKRLFLGPCEPFRSHKFEFSQALGDSLVRSRSGEWVGLGSPTSHLSHREVLATWNATG